MLASAVITKARYTLSDLGEDRWSNARLLSLFNDALLDVALTTRLYNTKRLMRVIEGVSEYDCSDEVISFERIEHLGVPLEILSYAEMDAKFRNEGSGFDNPRAAHSVRSYSNDYHSQYSDVPLDSKWQEEEGEVFTKIVYNLNKSGSFLLFPIPNIGEVVTVVDNSDFGIITGFDLEGLEPALIEDDMSLDDTALKQYLKLFYTRKPTRLLTVDDELDDVISDVMTSIFSHYLVGMALRDNMDTQNRTIGNEEIGLYEQGKRKLINYKNSGDTQREFKTQYRGMS